MTSCKVCLDNEELYSGSCKKCKYCENCLLDWIESKLSNDKSIEKVPCLIESCKAKINIHDIHKNISKKQEPKLQKILCNNYLKSATDIRPCPNGKCDYFAILPKGRCSQPFKCEKCSQQWEDRQYLSYYKLVPIAVREVKSELYSTCFEFFFTQKCPKCDTSILKNGGCSHMTCKKCNNYFCWHCKGGLNPHPSQLCFIRIMLFVLLFIQLFLHILDTMNCLSSLLYVLYPFKLIFYAFAYNWPLIFISSALVFIYIMIDSGRKFKQNRYHRSDFFKSLIALICTIFLGFLFHRILDSYFQISLELIINWQKIQWTFLIVFGSIIMGAIGFKSYIWDPWMRFVA